MAGTYARILGLVISLIGVPLATAADNREQDESNPDSLISERVKDELATADLPFVIIPHKVNYILPVTYDPSPNTVPYEQEFADTNGELDQFEAKFQISFKLPLWYNVFGDNGHLFFAYTNQSWWQVYNKDISSPFRETNHEPELFMLFNNDWEVFGMTNSFWGVGAVHQSNGKSGNLSRSWNRLYGTMIFDAGDLAVGTKVWWRLPEDAKEYPGDPRGDDNPDINRFMGNFELTAVYGLGKQRYSMMLRNNLRRDNKGAIELTWSYPILGNLRVYAQYFNGYGESLIDYNASTQRIGIGLALNDLL
ncbi:phospholipase A [Shewanella submarina]|uniref:Phospholipase A1 n=1 Tax=Shewanella submarina TaxID=2016376 RepID=A0ABV7GL48_9GAMM|nr:phospholipase A [Shewanella submarina]MCL1036093.1 phospholipase A [Shewanella submarina]